MGGAAGYETTLGYAQRCMLLQFLSRRPDSTVFLASLLGNTASGFKPDGKNYVQLSSRAHSVGVTELLVFFTDSMVGIAGDRQVLVQYSTAKLLQIPLGFAVLTAHTFSTRMNAASATQ